LFIQTRFGICYKIWFQQQFLNTSKQQNLVRSQIHFHLEFEILVQLSSTLEFYASKHSVRVF
jgi:hypothetical protein